MTQALMDAIRSWELEHGFSADTLARAKRGEPVKPSTAMRILKAMGMDPEEARKLAEQASSEDDDTAKEAV